eukprot:364357-Chlamydomonas_euryale.AAC.9
MPSRAPPPEHASPPLPASPPEHPPVSVHALFGPPPEHPPASACPACLVAQDPRASVHALPGLLRLSTLRAPARLSA